MVLTMIAEILLYDLLTLLMQVTKSGFQQERDVAFVFWENVEGVLTDKTNAFGCLVSSLAGLSDVINCPKWPNAGMVKGPKRNVAWRVLDAKYFWASSTAQATVCSCR